MRLQTVLLLSGYGAPPGKPATQFTAYIKQPLASSRECLRIVSRHRFQTTVSAATSLLGEYGDERHALT